MKKLLTGVCTDNTHTLKHVQSHTHKKQNDNNIKMTTKQTTRIILEIRAKQTEFCRHSLDAVMTVCDLVVL